MSKQQMTWKRVNDGLPVHELALLVRTADCTWQAAQYNFEFRWFETTDCVRIPFPLEGQMRVTHWMDVAPPDDDLPVSVAIARKALEAAK